MVILSKGCKPDSFESLNSRKPSFTNFWGLHSNFVEWESFLESNSSDILAQYEADLDDSIDFDNFSVRAYLPLVWSLKGFCHSYAWSCKLCEGGLPFARDLSLEISKSTLWILLMFSTGLLQLVSYFIFQYWSPSLSLCTIFDTISFNIDELLSINPSANVFTFKDWLTYSGGTDRSDEPRYNFSMKWPPQIVNFLIRISGCDSQSPFLLDLFLFSDAIICSTMAFHP